MYGYFENHFPVRSLDDYTHRIFLLKLNSSHTSKFTIPSHQLDMKMTRNKVHVYNPNIFLKPFRKRL